MKSCLITFLTTTLLVMASSAFAVEPLDGATVEHTPKGMPYCEKGCDIPEDCINNQAPARTGFKWACDNKKGFCIGKCVQVPISSSN